MRKLLWLAWAVAMVLWTLLALVVVVVALLLQSLATLLRIVADAALDGIAALLSLLNPDRAWVPVPGRIIQAKDRWRHTEVKP